MASLKDKFKSKIKQKNQPETMECFDQTCLNVQLTHGKSQLTEMKVHCGWINNKMNMRVPKLKCQWYNRTQKNYEQIIGIEEETYQPSILDVGSIVEVTCVPELPGINYEGMPILLKSEPITLAPETEIEAHRIQEVGRGKFIVNLQQVKIQQNTVPTGSEALIKIEKGCFSFFLLKVSHSNNQISDVFTITQQWPQLVISRKNPRRILMKLSESDSCVVLFKNGEVRDIFCLYVRLYLAKKALEQFEKEKQKIEQSISQQKPEKSKEEEKIECSNEEIQTKIEKIEEVSPQQEQTVQLSSSESFKSQKNQVSKQNKTTDLLQLLALKEENTKLCFENSKLQKQIEFFKEKTQNLENKLQQTNERLESASKNYFELQQKLINSNQINDSLTKEIETFKKCENSKLQEILYYKNQIKLITDQKSMFISQINDLTQRNAEFTKELGQYRLPSQINSSLSYQELIEQLRTMKQNYEQLKLKSVFYLQQRQQLEESLKNSRNLIEQMQSQKKYIEKRYESLTNQINTSSISPHNSQKDISVDNSLSSSFIFEETSPRLQTKESFLKLISTDSENREKQILQLKKQLKELVEENNYLRSMLTKEKKSTSRTHLKLELMEAKKIVSRLSEEIAEKQAVICHLKSMNKELNGRKDRLEADYQELLAQIKSQS